MHTLLRFLGSSCIGLLLLALIQLPTIHTMAATFTVITTNGTGPGSLLAVVTQANSTPGEHTIEFAVSGSFTPLTPLPSITNHLIFTVRGSNAVVLDGKAARSILTVASGATVILNRLQLINGRTNGDGGAINNAGILFLNSCVFSNNVATGQGGAVYNSAGASLNVRDGTFTACSAGAGGAIYSSGDLLLGATAFTSNSAEREGGAVHNGGVLGGIDLMFSGNQAASGGALFSNGNLQISGSTLSNNLAFSGSGGGIFNRGSASLSSISISFNTAVGIGGRAGTGKGSAGGGGGAGLGAGVFSQSGNLSATNVTFFGNRVIGGKGGSGSLQPGFEGLGGEGGGLAGGLGGSAFPSDWRVPTPGGFASGGGGAAASIYGVAPPGKGGFGGGGGGGAAFTAINVINSGAEGGFAGGKGGNPGDLGNFAKANVGGGGGGGAALGGGLFVEDGAVTLVNNTFTRNECVAGKGGDAAVIHATGDDGRALGGGIFNHQASVTLVNTLIVGNSASAPDVYGVFDSNGFNLVGSSQGASGLNILDFQDVDAKLGLLQDNGGPTFTCALLPGSPAIGSGTSNGAPAVDQRGALRPADRVDIGAFQVVTRIVPTITWNTPADITVGTPLSEAQLNAATSVPGTFHYDPAFGTILAVGNQQNLTVLFTPDDLVNFTSASASVALNVVKRSQSIVFDPLPDRHQDDPPFLLSATASSGLPVSYMVVSGPATVAGNFLTLSGATGMVTVRAVQPGNEIYRAALDVERTFTVVAPSGVRITEHPASQTVADGERVVLEVEAQGPALIYQWQFQNTNLPGETGSTLTVNSVHQAQAGAYRVIVSNSSGSVASQSAILTVRPKVSVARTAGQLSLTWGFGVLQSSTDLVHWTEVSNAQSPYRVPVVEPARFYRIEAR